jgi:hypothetical protein
MSVMTLYPYLYSDICWVFDDQQTSLKEEAFVLGASEMISTLLAAKCIPDARYGFALRFSDQPFDHDVELRLLLPEEASRATGQPVMGLPGTGNWYAGDVTGQTMVAWLCPALYEYFAEAPKRIFVKAEKLPVGVDRFGTSAATIRRHVATCRQSRAFSPGSVRLIGRSAIATMIQRIHALSGGEPFQTSQIVNPRFEKVMAARCKSAAGLGLSSSILVLRGTNWAFWSLVLRVLCGSQARSIWLSMAYIVVPPIEDARSRIS